MVLVTKECPCFQVVTASWKPPRGTLVMTVLKRGVVILTTFGVAS